jgi:hypothetical protein
MAKHSDERNYPNHLALMALLFLSVGAIALVSDTASAQQQQHLQVGGAAPRINPPERTDTTTVTPPNPATDKTLALGQALAACNQGEAVQEAFALPGLKGDVTLDRCYKGRTHLVCVFTALSAEAKSLTSAYRKIVDAKYPDLTTVDGICRLNPDSVTSDIAGSEEFTKRFAVLKSQYETATKCAINVEQALKDVTLANMTKAPEIIRSMTDSLDGDVTKISKVQEQISGLAEQMELSKKAMKTIKKIYHAICLLGERAAEKSGN